TERGRAVLRGEGEVPALTSAGAVRATAADAAPLAGRDAGTPGGRGAAGGGRSRRAIGPRGDDQRHFLSLRGPQRAVVGERGVSPYVVFSDASLRDMARLKPRTREALLEVKGVGEWKAETFGERFLAVVRQQPGAG